MKNIAIMGCTGSIGRQTIEVISSLGPEYRVVAMAAGKDDKQMAGQIAKINPEVAAIYNSDAAERLTNNLKPDSYDIRSGPEGQLAVATWPSADLVVMAQVGFSGLEPLIAALKEGKMIALANKESLVTGGEIIERLGLLKQERILPIDSEHSAIRQCLESTSPGEINKIYLTASGGPFYGWKKADLKKVTPVMAIKHPNWKMGYKISVDSATMINKGLEVMEAKWLFGLDLKQIEVVIHRQSVIHSMVEYIDGSILAQLGLPDMRLPIQYALTYPERRKSGFERFNPIGRNLSFEEPDWINFPGLELAYRAARMGGTMPTVFNGANEISVEQFLARKINFTDIPTVIDAAMREHTPIDKPEICDIIDADNWSRLKSAEFIASLQRKVN